MKILDISLPAISLLLVHFSINLFRQQTLIPLEQISSLSLSLMYFFLLSHVLFISVTCIHNNVLMRSILWKFSYKFLHHMGLVCWSVWGLFTFCGLDIRWLIPKLENQGSFRRLPEKAVFFFFFFLSRKRRNITIKPI